MSAAGPDFDGRSFRQFAIPIGIGAGGCVVIAVAAIWLLSADRFPGTPHSAVASAERSCAPITASSWSASGKTGNNWAITTNLASCDDVRELVGGLAGKGMMALPDENGFRCTAGSTVGGHVLSGICYSTGSFSAYFAWGADVAPYDHPAPCDRCTGVPGEHFSTLVDTGPAP